MTEMDMDTPRTRRHHREDHPIIRERESMAREPRILEVIDELEKALELLAETCSQLQNQLSPISRDLKEVEAPDSIMAPASKDISGTNARLRSIVQRVHSVRSHIAEIDQRIDL